MTTPVTWSITAIGSDTVVRSAQAGDHEAAWTAALRAAHTALLTGELDTLAVTIGDHDSWALYNPLRDEHGHINPHQLTAALVDLHQAATAGDIADLLTS